MVLLALVSLGGMPRDEKGVDAADVLPIAREIFPGIVSVGDPRDGLFPLYGENEQLLGWATSTLPEAGNIQGYSGPSELLVIFDADRRVKTIRFLASADTDGHVEKVLRDGKFWSQWDGVAESALGKKVSPVVVSGATLTSEAMARGVAARFGAEGMEQWFPDGLELDDVRKWFPEGDKIDFAKAKGTYRIFKGEKPLGTVLRSSRMGVSARGFNGTSDVIVALGLDGDSVLGIGFLGSRDNEPYISDVRDEVKYTDGFAGKRVAEILEEDAKSSPSLFTSGASYTNSAVVESVREMLNRHMADSEQKPFPWKEALAILWIGMGVYLGLSKRGGKRA
ncbi:MAG: FMN-binding protein, partial [Verrucomicrobiota bacterium]